MARTICISNRRGTSELFLLMLHIHDHLWLDKGWPIPVRIVSACKIFALIIASHSHTVWEEIGRSNEQ